MKLHGIDKPGMRVGVLGLGGLGSMAVKFGAAFGCDITVISTSPAKEAAARELGATRFLVSSNAEAMKAAAGSLDAIIDTVSGDHDINTYLDLLDVDGRLVIVGVPPQPLSLNAGAVIFGGKSITGSLIGGVPITQEMLNFCGEKNIVSDIEVLFPPGRAGLLCLTPFSLPENPNHVCQ
jgi:D-arabinose 1-dehydrogenase-like Zn-dependent alcohol dehydrogenase